MPMRHAIWTVGDQPVALTRSRLTSENQLETMIAGDSRILSDEWMLIARQELTDFGKRIDLLAIAPDGSLVLIELKRDRTPREVIAQALDYASWVDRLSAEQILRMYERFSHGGSLPEAFRARFHGAELDEETLNQSHQIVIVAAELDDSTERIVNYLSSRNLPINVVFFEVFQHGLEQFLSRAWLLDPGVTQVIAAEQAGSEKGPWNGEYYVSFGDPSSRNWEEARNYGFISAGGGSWYSQTLKLLSPGDRIWVNIPRRGYVGVGRVAEGRAMAKDFLVPTSDGERPATEALQHSALYREHADDPDKSEYFVKVAWLDTVPESQAISGVGLFGNQNTVCKPVSTKWQDTVERLKSRLPRWNRDSAATPEV